LVGRVVRLVAVSVCVGRPIRVSVAGVCVACGVRGFRLGERVRICNWCGSVGFIFVYIGSVVCGSFVVECVDVVVVSGAVYCGVVDIFVRGFRVYGVFSARASVVACVGGREWCERDRVVRDGVITAAVVFSVVFSVVFLVGFFRVGVEVRVHGYAVWYECVGGYGDVVGGDGECVGIARIGVGISSVGCVWLWCIAVAVGGMGLV